MAAVGTRADALGVITSGDVVMQHLRAVGTIPGVLIKRVAARNGPGTGRLLSTLGGRWLHWQAPGSVLLGDGVRCDADGEYLLEDGADPDKWIRVQVAVAHLIPGPVEGLVYLDDRYDNQISGGDYLPGEGWEPITRVRLRNQSPRTLLDLRVWMTDPYDDFDLALGKVFVGPFYKPTAEDHPDVLVWTSVAPAASKNVYVQWTIVDANAWSPNILTALHFRWESL